MGYSMEAEIEASRLEEQVYQLNYSLRNEMSHFTFNKNETVLDVGCGTGVLSRYLVNNFNVSQVIGVDSSDMRLAQAKKLIKSEREINSITFERSDLMNLNPVFHKKFDTVVARYVLEHLENSEKAILEIKKVLKNNGRIIIVELDGVFINLYTENNKLNTYMNEIRKKFKMDLEIGKKLPSMLKRLGFKEIQWNVDLVCCKNQRLAEEVANTEKRFTGAKFFFQELLGSESKFEEFRDLYLDEMKKNENPLLFNKYYIEARVE